ncbi:PIN domain-containing protein, partial [Francisella tularensis]|uniref:PIN domain-containing protein n=1 Tax=Francisella tularensis TaxID=263 RepID=UPI001322D619
EHGLGLLNSFLQIENPSQIILEEADRLQREWPLDPFDSIVLAQAISLGTMLISRDNRFLHIAKQYLPSFSPEEYIETIIDFPGSEN